MPTKKPRVQVTLNENTHEVIKRFAELQNKTRGAVISEFLDSIVPPLSRTVALLDAAHSAPDHVKKGLVDYVESTHNDLMSILSDANSQVDNLAQNFTKNGAPVEGFQPPLVTRGSDKGKIKPKNSLKVAKNRASRKKHGR
jgi:hypothetical protein